MSAISSISFFKFPALLAFQTETRLQDLMDAADIELEEELDEQWWRKMNPLTMDREDPEWGNEPVRWSGGMCPRKPKNSMDGGEMQRRTGRGASIESFIVSDSDDNPRPRRALQNETRIPRMTCGFSMSDDSEDDIEMEDEEEDQRENEEEQDVDWRERYNYVEKRLGEELEEAGRKRAEMDKLLTENENQKQQIGELKNALKRRSVIEPSEEEANDDALPQRTRPSFHPFLDDLGKLGELEKAIDESDKAKEEAEKRHRTREDAAWHEADVASRAAGLAIREINRLRKQTKQSAEQYQILDDLCDAFHAKYDESSSQSERMKTDGGRQVWDLKKQLIVMTAQLNKSKKNENDIRERLSQAEEREMARNISADSETLKMNEAMENMQKAQNAREVAEERMNNMTKEISELKKKHEEDKLAMIEKMKKQSLDLDQVKLELQFEKETRMAKETENKKLIEEKVVVDKQLDQTTIELNKSKKHAEYLGQRLRQADAKETQRKNEADAEAARLASELKQATESAQKLSIELDNTKKEVEDLKEKLRQAESALESEKLSRSSVESEASRLVSQLEQSTGNKETLDQQLKEKNETIEKLEKNVETLSADLEKLKEEKEAVGVKLCQSDDAKLEKEKELGELSAELQRVRKELEERGEALKGMETIVKEKADLVTQLQEANSSMVQLKEDKDASAREVEGLRAQLLTAQDQLEKEKECRAKAVTDAARFEAALASKTTAHANMSTMYQNTQHTISALMRDVESFKKQVDTLQAKINASDFDVARLRGELAQAKADKDDAMILMQYTRSEAERSIQELHKLRLENADIGAKPQIAAASTAAAAPPNAMVAVLQKASELPQTPLPTATIPETPAPQGGNPRRGVGKPRVGMKTPVASNEASIPSLAVETRSSLRKLIESLPVESPKKTETEELPDLPKGARRSTKKGALSKDKSEVVPKRGRKSSIEKATRKPKSPSTADELPDVQSSRAVGAEEVAEPPKRKRARPSTKH